MKWPRVVEIENAPTPIAVYEDDDGELVVEVDSELKGRERAAAIISAVRSYKRNFGSLILLPIALYAWEPIKYVTQNHPGAALSTAAGVGLIATSTVLPVVQDNRPELNPAAPMRTVVAIITATSAQLPTQSPTTQRTPRPPRSTSTSPPTREALAPAETRRPVTPRPEPGPRRTHEPTRSSTPKASISESATRPPTGAADVDSAPTSAPADTPAAPLSSADAVESDPPNAAEPTPQRDCLLAISLDPLLHACVG